MGLKRKSEKLEIVTKGLICQSFYAYRTKESILQKLGSRDIWKIAKIVFSTKVNLLQLNLMILTCCLLHVRSQSYLLKLILRTLILMTRLSLYLLSQRRLVLILFQWCFWRRVKLNFHTYQLNCSICIWMIHVFQIVGKSNLLYLYLKMLWIGLQLKLPPSESSFYVGKIISSK